MPSNRDIYLAINSLSQNEANSSPRSLEDYLLALLNLSRSYQNSPNLTPEEFLSLLRRALTEVPAPYDPQWAINRSQRERTLTGFPHFESVLVLQIVDLHEMQEQGILDGEWISLGTNSPNGGRWYNFSPSSYLECAAAGSMGGWEPGDPGGRDFVPGEVAILDPDGEITSAQPQDVDRPIFAINSITWEMFIDFLESGRLYE